MSGALQISGVSLRYGAVTALERIDLTVQPGEMLTLLGPSGSGKTTLLKVIAGFETPDTGDVVVGERDITMAQPHERDLGMVFQNYALFPHMTVAENVAFPLKMRKLPRAERDRRVQQALELVELPDHGGRLPKQLSGGQQQRVALARAVVFGPKLLLLDEPFSALDRKLREQMQLEVRKLQRRLNLTAIFVTHDQEEALVLSDRIAVMQSGRIVQLGAPQAIYQTPVDRFVAGFIGESNLFPAVSRAAGQAVLDTGETVAHQACATAVAPQEKVGILLRPDRARALDGGEREDAAAGVAFQATVQEVVYLGETVKLKLRTDAGAELLVRWPFDTRWAGVPVGTRLPVGWHREDVQCVRWQ